MNWQPIETAPYGERILVYNPVCGIYSSERVDSGEYPLGIWNGHFGPWYPAPTHWMSLPEPPESTSKGAISTDPVGV